MKKYFLGFTLVELMVSITILILIGSIITSSIMMINRVQRRNAIMRESQQFQRTVIDSIIRDAKSAHYIGIQNVGTNNTLNLSWDNGVTISYRATGTPRTVEKKTTSGGTATTETIFNPVLVRVDRLRFSNPNSNLKLLNIEIQFIQTNAGMAGSVYDSDNLFYKISVNLEGLK